MTTNGVEVKRRIRLELIVKGRKKFEVSGECNDCALENSTMIHWRKQKPDSEKCGIPLADSNKTLEQTYRDMFLVINARSYGDNTYEIKLIRGRRIWQQVIGEKHWSNLKENLQLKLNILNITNQKTEPLGLQSKNAKNAADLERI